MHAQADSDRIWAHRTLLHPVLRLTITTAQVGDRVARRFAFAFGIATGSQ